MASVSNDPAVHKVEQRKKWIKQGPVRMMERQAHFHGPITGQAAILKILKIKRINLLICQHRRSTIHGLSASFSKEKAAVKAADY